MKAWPHELPVIIMANDTLAGAGVGSLVPGDPMVGLVRVLDFLTITDFNGIRKASERGNAEEDERLGLKVYGDKFCSCFEGMSKLNNVIW